MKQSRLFIPIVILFISVILCQCTIKKRAYRDGYFIAWNKKSTKVKETSEKVTPEKTTEHLTTLSAENIKSKEDENIYVSAQSADKEGLKISKRKTFTIAPDSCGDKITLKNGDEIFARIIEVGSKTVKYKRCDNPDGPLIIANTENVFMIKYANGTKEIFRKDEAPEATLTVKKERDIQKRPNPWAIASLVIGCLFFIVYIAPLALIFGIVAINQIDRNPDLYSGKGLAIAGVVLGIIGTLILILLLITLFLFI